MPNVSREKKRAKYKINKVQDELLKSNSGLARTLQTPPGISHQLYPSAVLFHPQPAASGHLVGQFGALLLSSSAWLVFTRQRVVAMIIIQD